MTMMWITIIKLIFPLRMVWQPLGEDDSEHLNDGSVMENCFVRGMIYHHSSELYSLMNVSRSDFACSIVVTDHCEVNSSYSLQAHPGLVKAANFIYVRLLELDCMLGFFLGEQSLFPFWKRLKYLSTRLEEIETEDSYYSTKLELFAALHKILQIDMSDDAGVTEFLQYFHKIRTAQPALQFERIATCTPDKEPTNAQELKLFSNLLFMMLYCRTASVAEYYGQQTSMQARNLQPADRDRPSIVNDLRLTGFRSRSLECKQATKHAKFLLAAFERLCEVDSEATAACWFRLHGALIAAVIVGVAGIRERSVEHETGLVKTLPRIRKCFQSLRKLNPQCAVFEWAEAFFNEFDRIRKQAVEKIKSSSTLGRRLSDSASDMSVGVVASRGPSVKIDEDASTPTARRKRSISEVEASTPLVKVKVRKTKGQLRKQHADDCGDVAAQGVNAIQALPSSLTNPQHDAYAYNDTAAMEAYASYPSSVNTSFTEVGAQPSLMQAYAFHYPGPPAELSTEYAIHPPMNLDTEVYDPDRYYLDPALQVNVPWHESVMQNAGFMYGSAPIPSLSPLHPPQPSPAHLSATSMLPPSHILSSPPDKASAGTGFFNMTTENFEAEQASNTHTITGGHNDHRPPYAHTHNDAIQGTAQSAYHYLAPQASPSETSNTPAWQRPALSKQPSQGQGQQQFYEQNAFYPHSATTAFHSHSRHESENEAQSSYAVGQQHHQNQFRGLSMPS